MTLLTRALIKRVLDMLYFENDKGRNKTNLIVISTALLSLGIVAQLKDPFDIIELIDNKECL